MYQCPVSAIPGQVMDLLQLWRDCRLLKALPEPGGFMDQPRAVRRAFPVFEQLMQDTEAARDLEQQKQSIAATVAAMVRVRGGG